MITEKVEDVKFNVKIYPTFAHLSKNLLVYAGKCLMDMTTNKIISQVTDGYVIRPNADIMKAVKFHFSKVKWQWAYYRPSKTLFHIYGKIDDNFFVEIINGYGRAAGCRINYGRIIDNNYVFTNLPALIVPKDITDVYDYDCQTNMLKALRVFTATLSMMGIGQGTNRGAPLNFKKIPFKFRALGGGYENLRDYLTNVVCIITKEWSRTNFEAARNMQATYFTNLFNAGRYYDNI